MRIQDAGCRQGFEAVAEAREVQIVVVLRLLILVAVFIAFVVRANFDVAYRVLNIYMPIRPGIVKVRTALKTDMARTFLANSITLTPGTLSVDMIDDHLYVHWINITSEDPEKETEIIVRRFEKLLERVFE